MLKILTAAAFVAASIAAAPALAGAGYDYRAQSYGDPSYNRHETQNNYQENPAFTQGCPRGSVPESFPNQNGRRCALPGGGYTY